MPLHEVCHISGGDYGTNGGNGMRADPSTVRPSDDPAEPKIRAVDNQGTVV
jgi:hypothetical protein